MPLVPTSARTGEGLNKLIPLAERIYAECGTRVSTGLLNRAMEETLTRHQAPVVRRVRPKFFYLTQAESEPPTFVCFVNDADRVAPSYARYLERSPAPHVRHTARAHAPASEILSRQAGEKVVRRAMRKLPHGLFFMTARSPHPAGGSPRRAARVTSYAPSPGPKANRSLRVLRQRRNDRKATHFRTRPSPTRPPLPEAPARQAQRLRPGDASEKRPHHPNAEETP